MITLTGDEARVIALRAQGFGGREYAQPVDVLDHLGVVQLDSVTTVARSHELTVFARYGPYDVPALYDAVYAGRRGFEYWGHAASWLPMQEYRYFLHRMSILSDSGRKASTVNKQVRREHAELYGHVLGRIRAEGALGAADFADSPGAGGGWWNFKPAKLVLEDLFDQGRLLCVGRHRGFQRLYDLPERYIPPATDQTDPGALQAVGHLIKRAVQALGVATPREAADYYRCYRWPVPWQEALQHLLDADEVIEVRVEGWRAQGVTTRANLESARGEPEHRPCFLSPWDNLIWERRRVKRLFNFAYRLEIYLPKARREFGYYVMPLLAGGRLRGRADLKLERDSKTLQVLGMWLEDDALAEAAAALADLAQQLDAEAIKIENLNVGCRSTVPSVTVGAS